MAAYGAATSLKITILSIPQSSRVSLAPPPPIISQFASSCFAMFDSPFLKGSMAAFLLKITIQRSSQTSLLPQMSRVIAAYVGASFLKRKIQGILPPSPSANILLPAYLAVCRLQRVLLKLDDTGCSKIRTKVNALDDRIKEVIWEFEDLLESHFYNQILPQLESDRGRLSYSIDLQSLRQSVDYFVERVTEMAAEYIVELANMPEEEGEPLSSRIDFSGINSKMVGLSNQFDEAKNGLLLPQGERNWLLVTGMVGIGKTTLAKKVFDDAYIQRHFELRAWVRVGRKCESNETLRCILAQVDPNNHYLMLDDDYHQLVGFLKMILWGKKCLIVLDDVWEWDARLMGHLPRENVQVLITSRLKIKESPVLTLGLLNEEQSKKLLGEQVFGEDGFPPHLEELGEEIAKKCEGLPLMIVTVAEFLSKEDQTTENWTEIVRTQHNSVFVGAYNQISEVFFPSYDYLPQYFKMLFLYMGASPPYSAVDVDNIVHQLHAEGFLEPNLGENSVEEFISKCFAEFLYRYHLVRRKEYPWKGIRVHSCWKYMSRKEASKIKFLHVLQSCDDDMKDQRRLCAHCNTLFAFRQVCDSIKSDCSSISRSLLCFGPYHQYPVPIHTMGFKLLRLLDAVTVRFYHIPLEIMKMISLKYLALTCNGELPTSIANLFQLQSLTIGQHTNIKKRGVHSYMPLEIWDMQELHRIEISGRDLPTPNSDATLDKLIVLRGVSPKSCTRDILKRIPILRDLTIQLELKPYEDDDDRNPLSGLDYFAEELQNLECLKCIVQNPDMKYELMVPLSMFPSCLLTLELSGIGCPWNHISDIGLLLPNLVFLHIYDYAFRGPEWYIKSQCFPNLETLVIKDTDLVRWRAQPGSLPRLDNLSFCDCYRLQQLDWTRDPSMDRTSIFLIDCNPLAISSAMQLPRCRVLTHSTF
ncbi:putative late blight resistance protein homolog R1A-10 [Salvia hispanica]|uniref:putative late blight resistance protein homolog R1A-10 n=1 Tax=Salvia hispanica TaxID=49212 RepID=UPI0020094453|nr:putative late blight resistance protein homolog R1A-10 [Salvia hispanica]